MMTLGGKNIPMYRFQAKPNEPAEYFDTKGESAKGLLMKSHGLDEEAAYSLLRRTAMDRKLKLAEVAQLLIDAPQ